MWGEWFDKSTSLEMLFMGCAVFGGAIFVLRIIMMMIFGLDHHGVDHVDLSDSNLHDVSGHPDDVGHWLTFNGLMGFLMMFGIVGMALLDEYELGQGTAILGAFAAGVATMYLIARVLAMMLKLQSSGTIKINNAVGQEGSVYLKIPPGARGKIQVTVQNRLIESEAICEDENEELKTGTRIVVVEVGGDGLMVVKKVT